MRSRHLDGLERHIRRKARALRWTYARGVGDLSFSVPGGGTVNFKLWTWKGCFVGWVARGNSGAWHSTPINKTRRRAQQMIDAALKGLKAVRS